ncbi:MAG: Tim44 domain-containing protein, partial [Gammaproteobacteria bacterium]|nr:Tim44 domain-containing protein [Gammaproteobacteria bacterium]
VFAEIQDQFRSRSGKNETEIMNLDARVLEVVDTGNDIEASVMFTAQLREIDENSGVYPEPVHVEEIWHFVKPKKSINPTWFLDGIQQVED